jgi:hypothetical protein
VLTKLRVGWMPEQQRQEEKKEQKKDFFFFDVFADG